MSHGCWWRMAFLDRCVVAKEDLETLPHDEAVEVTWLWQLYEHV